MLSGFFMGTASAQETRYIRDVIYVPLRSGQSTQHRIVHKGLVSGTPLTELEVNKDSGYSRVTTVGGNEGWIQTQYLSPEPAARNVLKKTNLTIEKLRKETSTLNQKLSQLKKQDKSSNSSIAQLSGENKKISLELNKIKSISANAIKINSDNNRLLEENQDLKNQLDIVSANNQRLSDDSESDSFLNGAFAVLIGVMITLAVPRLWPKKSTDWA
jgi:SH3 domain protein